MTLIFNKWRPLLTSGRRFRINAITSSHVVWQSSGHAGAGVTAGFSLSHPDRLNKRTKMFYNKVSNFFIASALIESTISIYGFMAL